MRFHATLNTEDPILISNNFSDSLLQLPSLQVFKQEAPSPTNNENQGNASNGGGIHMQQQQSPTSQQNGRIDNNNNQNNGNSSLQHLLNGYNSNIISSEWGVDTQRTK